jgi:large subunit ribosomal protein L6
MSNLAKLSIKIPKGIVIKKIKDLLIIKGPLGQKELFLKTNICLFEFNSKTLDSTSNFFYVSTYLLPEYKKEKFRLNAKALQGTATALIKQTYVGLRSGFRIQLKLVGVGYKVKIEFGFILTLKLGYSHVVSIIIPVGLKVTCFKKSVISIFGSDKQQVNNFAAVIRAYKKPEPYKGKGILYQNEKISLKEGKRS